MSATGSIQEAKDRLDTAMGETNRMQLLLQEQTEHLLDTSDYDVLMETWHKIYDNLRAARRAL